MKIKKRKWYIGLEWDELEEALIKLQKKKKTKENLPHCLEIWFVNSTFQSPLFGREEKYCFVRKKRKIVDLKSFFFQYVDERFGFIRV